MKSRLSDDCALAPLYVLGVASAEERKRFKAHIATGCPDCSTDVEDVTEVTSLLAFAAPPAPPPDTLRARLLGHVKTFGHWPPGFVQFAARATDLPWQFPAPGVAIKLLHVDRQARRQVLLVRGVPGACFPAHRHAGIEELHVLEGGVQFGDEEYEAGETIRMGKETIHGSSETHEGCLFLLRGSLDDEIVGE